MGNIIFCFEFICGFFLVYDYKFILVYIEIFVLNLFVIVCIFSLYELKFNIV